MTPSGSGAVDIMSEDRRLHAERSHEWNCYIRDQINSKDFWLEQHVPVPSSEAMELASQISQRSDGDHSKPKRTGDTSSTTSYTRLTSGCSKTPIALPNQTNEVPDFPKSPAKTSAESFRARETSKPAKSTSGVIHQCNVDSNDFKVPLKNKSSTGDAATVVHRDFFYSIAIVVICVAMAFLVLRRTFFMV